MAIYILRRAQTQSTVGEILTKSNSTSIPAGKTASEISIGTRLYRHRSIHDPRRIGIDLVEIARFEDTDGAIG